MLKIDVKGDVMVFTTERGGYKFYQGTIGKKLKSGEWDNAYIDFIFPKGTDIPNKTKIDVQEGWLTFDKHTNKEGKNITEWKLFIYKYEADGVPIGFEPIKDEDIPF